MIRMVREEGIFTAAYQVTSRKNQPRDRAREAAENRESSDSAERDLDDGVTCVLLQDEVRSRARRQDVFLEVNQVDPPPQPVGDLVRLQPTDCGIAVEVRMRVAERGLAQPLEALDVPAPDVGLVGVEVDREIEEI